MPPLVNYQGRLANPDGSSFPTADYELRLSIYDAATGGRLVWGPQVFDGAVGVGHGPRVPVLQGFSNLMLGPVDSQGRSILRAFGNSNRFVEIVLGGRAPIQPRQQIPPTPFAVQSANGSPPGTIVAFGGPAAKIPPGWLLCDGAVLATNDYPELYTAIGTYWGDGTKDILGGTGLPAGTGFNAPDLRGLFLRGASIGPQHRDRDGGVIDADRLGRIPMMPGGNASNAEVGSLQLDGFQNHTHSYFVGDWPSGTAPKVSENPGGNVSLRRVTQTQSVSGRTASETRPANAYIHYIIKY